MILIAGASALYCNKQFRKLIAKSCYRSIIRNILKCDSRSVIYQQTGKHMSCLNTGMPSYIPVNSVYWPLGANRFGVGAFLVTEEAASIILATSAAQSTSTIAYDKTCITSYEYYKDNELINKHVPGGEVGDNSLLIGKIRGSSGNKNPSNDEITWASIYAQHGSNNQQNVHWNLTPVPVLIAQRSWYANPLRYQAFFWALMIPIAYIPLVDSDYIINQTKFMFREIEGAGIIIMVDQRYLWKFTYIPNLFLIEPGLNNKYEGWYTILNIIKKYLAEWQYKPEHLSPYGRKFFHELIIPNAPPLDPSVRNAFDDDRAFMGPPTTLASEGRDLTLAELMALVEQSLGKKLIFHPNWQIEFIEPLAARQRLMRNTLRYAPRVLYMPEEQEYNSSAVGFTESNRELYDEAGIPRPKDFTREELAKPPQDIPIGTHVFDREFSAATGGLIANTAKRGLWVDSDNVGVESVEIMYAFHETAYTFPEPRYTITLPHAIQVVGNLWRLPIDTVEFVDQKFVWPAGELPGASPWLFPARIYQFAFFRMSADMPFDTVTLLSRIYSFRYVYYTAYLIEKSIIKNDNYKQVVVDDKNKFDTQNMNNDRYDTLDDLHYPFQFGNVKYKVFTDLHLPGTKLGAYNTIPFDFSAIRILTTNLCMMKEGSFGSFATHPQTGKGVQKYAFTNKKQSFYTGRQVARNFLAWCAFPFHWTFYECNYWPLTGFEDYIMVKQNGLVHVCGHHYKLLRKDVGVRYVGLETPTREMDFYAYDKRALMNCCGTTDAPSVVLCDDAVSCVTRPNRPLGCYEHGDIGPFRKREEAISAAESHINRLPKCPYGDWKFAVYCIMRESGNVTPNVPGQNPAGSNIEWRAVIYCCKNAPPFT